LVPYLLTPILVLARRRYGSPQVKALRGERPANIVGR
jgi:hypothetical protein